MVPGSHVVPLQQPFGHEFSLQTQPPWTHACPAPQAAPPPQVHAPAPLHPSPEVPQLRHAPPAVPHAPGVCASHTLPLQQPLAHDDAVHTHLPPMHACPAPHAAPLPHVHEPPEQPSVTPAAQPVQLSPPAPHAELEVDVTHVPSLWQQPVGQDAASQVHAWFTHSCPAPHVGPLPHWHRPDVEQLSALVASQATHAAAPLPHADSDAMLHVAPAQQPVVHVSAQPEQRPSPLHVWPDGHAAHVLPPAPHAAFRLPGSHVVPLQHPDGQPMASHWHTPLRQCWPPTQAAPVPHEHAPVALHPSEVTALQAMQDAPAAPHATLVAVWQCCVASQQPSGHDVGEHWQTPLRHT